MSFPTVSTMQRLLSQYGLIYLSRANWGHTAPLGPAMPGYASGIHVHHSVTLADDDQDYAATEDVVADMKEIERIGVQRFGRFSYSFAIHPSGVIAEGAGFTIGAHTSNYNSSTFGIVFIGNLDRDPFTPRMVTAFKALVTVLRVSDAAADDCYIKPHRERKATACPGAHTMLGWNELTNLASIPVPATSPTGPFAPPTPISTNHPDTEEEQDMRSEYLVRTPDGTIRYVNTDSGVDVPLDGSAAGTFARAGVPSIDMDTYPAQQLSQQLTEVRSR